MMMPLEIALFLPMMGVGTTAVVLVLVFGENHQRAHPENGQDQEDDSGRRGVRLQCRVEVGGKLFGE